MAFLEKEEMKNVIREYQLDAITDNDDSIVTDAIALAVEEAANMLTPSNKKEWNDGRIKYDAAAIFNATGNNRNMLMMGYVRIMALYWLCSLSSVGADYRDVKERYDTVKKDLKELAEGVTSSATLPQIIAPVPEDEKPFSSGSHPKFNHYY